MAGSLLGTRVSQVIPTLPPPPRFWLSSAGAGAAGRGVEARGWDRPGKRGARGGEEPPQPGRPDTTWRSLGEES